MDGYWPNLSSLLKFEVEFIQYFCKSAAFSPKLCYHTLDLEFHRQQGISI
jgi:hypothetical protein